MKLVPQSIAGRLFAGFFIGAAVILIAAGVFLQNEVSDIVIGSVDRTLHSKRQMITGLLHEEHGRVELELSEIIAGEYVIPRSGHYYKVVSDKAVLAASPSLTDDHFEFPGADNGRLSTSTGPDDEPVRLLRYHYAAFDKNFEITIAESLVDSLAMISAFRSFLLVSIPSSLAILCFAAWWIARESLRPLSSFSETIETITHRNLADRIEGETTARELAGLARSFNAMLDRLQAVFEGQKRLVADASHELKTPLSVIRTHCDVALQRPRSAEEYAEALQTIQLSARNMTRLINDLLSLARLDAGLLSSEILTPVFLGDCVADALQMTGPLARERRVTLSSAIEEDCSVTGSRTALTEAFLNLIENAVRYNGEEGRVSVVAKAENGKAVITVSDTGSGIRKNDLARIFERFYRADAVRGSEGTGLGLSIVKSVVEAHGGEISVESEPGKGSTFQVMLPLAVREGGPS